MPQPEVRETLGRWMFERSEVWGSLASPDGATWGEYVDRNREEWREEADLILEMVDGFRSDQKPIVPDDAPRDWRGTPITVGATVVYGGPVGRSIQQVEGTVDGFTKSGRVNVRIVRRSYTTPFGGRDKLVVDVGTDRLTVVESLPPTDKPTWAELVANAAAAHGRWSENYDTHDIQRVDPPRGATYGVTYCCVRCARTSPQCGTEKCDA